MNHRAVCIASLLIIAALGLALRLPQLNRRYVHTDESVHAYKLNELRSTGRYVYDPDEYHGPTLYYFTLPVMWLTGSADWRDTTAATHRIVPVLFGVGLILLSGLLADGLGWGAILIAGLLTAVSPAMSYYSRYYIQETMLVFFTLLVLAAGWRYVRSGRIGWLLLAGVGVGLMHATKETCVIVWAALAAALLVAWWWGRVVPSGEVRPDRRESRRYTPWAFGAALGVALAVSAVLLSGWGTNPRGAWDAWGTFGTYLSRAGGGAHIHLWHYYFRTLLYWHRPPAPAWSEALILVLGVVGLVAAFRRGRTLSRFIAVYTLLLTGAYAAIPYKTPWCVLGFLHGWILLAGVGGTALLRMAAGGFFRLAVLLVVLTIGTVHLGVQAWRADTRFCNSVRNPYVYAAPVHDVLNLTSYVGQLAQVQPPDEPLVIHVVVSNCWPLPWYLRDQQYVGYWETPPPEPDADIIIASCNFEADVAARLREKYDTPRYYGLRRDETLVVYVRRQLRAAFERAHATP